MSATACLHPIRQIADQTLNAFSYADLIATQRLLNRTHQILPSERAELQQMLTGAALLMKNTLPKDTV